MQILQQRQRRNCRMSSLSSSRSAGKMFLVFSIAVAVVGVLNNLLSSQSRSSTTSEISPIIGNDRDLNDEPRLHAKETTTAVADRSPSAECTDICHCWRIRGSSSSSTTTTSSIGGSDGTSLSTILSPSSTWNRLRNDILEATLHVDEAGSNTTIREAYIQWVDTLFTATTSIKQLQRAVEALPTTNNAGMKSIRAILTNRLRDPTTSPPLKIAVLGGSVTAGHGCLDNPLGIPTKSFMKSQIPCAWPARIQRLIDKLLSKAVVWGEDHVDNNNNTGLVRITNMAMAATTSDIGSTVVDYQLWPTELLPDGPDVIVAAFAVNDALDSSSQDEIFQKVQQLIASVSKERNCREDKLPILIYVDDFIAWPGKMRQYLEFHRNLHELTDWHGIGFVSYANAFREMVLAATNVRDESTFKAPWTVNKRGKLNPNPHPGMSFNIMMTWVLSYYLLNIGFTLCDGSIDDEDVTKSTNVNSSVGTNPVSPRVPKVHRPLLNEDLEIERIPELWNNIESSEMERCQSSIPGARCGFVWVANRVSEFKGAKEIEKFLEPYIHINDGWKADGDSYRNKHGWIAQKQNAQFELHIRSTPSTIRYLTILSIVSYGEEWIGSKVSVTVNGKDVLSIDGYHETQTSVILPHKIELPETIHVGESMKIRFDLVGGSTFKITGMAFCSV